MSIDFLGVFSIASALAIFTVLYLYIGFRISERVIHPKMYNYDEIIKIENDYSSEETGYFNDLIKEEVFISSDKGFILHGFFIPFENSKKSVVLIHGFAYNLMGAVKYIGIFRRLGFNILLFDNRYHGKSEGDMVTFGFNEKADLKKLVDWIVNRIPNSSIIGTHGESMGAAIAIEHAAIDDRVSFVVADCPYSRWKDIIYHQLRKRHRYFGGSFLPAVNLWINIRSGIAFSDVDLVKSVRTIETPILFFHGEEDRYTPHKMTEELYKNKIGSKKLVIVPGARHAESFRVDKEKYESEIVEFLKKEVVFLENKS